MKSRWFLSLAAILGLALFSSHSIPVAAATPTVKLVLGGTPGATPWAIGNIAPGNSGTSTVTLSNTGFSDGAVTIWLSDIVNDESANPEPVPGKLSEYLILNVTGTNLSTDFVMPAIIDDFPQNATDTKHIYVNPLKAFSTLTLQWDWQLPLATGNDVQGDSLSFTINYALEEFPPLPSTPLPPQGGGGGGGGVPPVVNQEGTTPEPPRSIPFVSFVDTTKLSIISDASTINGSTTKPYVAAFFENRLTLQFDVNTMITLSNGQPPEQVDLKIVQAGPLPDKGSVIVSPIYQISVGNDSSGNYQEVNFDPPVTITLQYDPAAIPQNATSLYIACSEGNPNPLEPGWVRLDQPTGYVPEIGQVSGVLTHLSLFTVMAELAPSPPLPVPPQAAPVLPEPSEIQKVVSVWLIPIILAVIGAAALVYYIVFIMMRRRWDWIPYILPAGAVNVLAQTAEQRALYATKHQKRVAELASAITREMNLSKKGDDILLEARILAVADTVETMADTVKTMSSSRPYRPAMGLDKILEEIKRNSSTPYDSEVVKAFERLVDRGKFRFQTLYD